MAVYKLQIVDEEGNVVQQDDITPIEQVNVEVSQTTGEASGSGSYADGVLALHFEGIKGEQGEEGEQGEKGDTVILGDGQEYTLYNVSGSNTDGAMTQNAVTNALFVENKDINLSNLSIVGGYVNGGNVWQADATGQAQSVFVPCVGGKQYRIVGNANTSYKSNYVFVKTNSLTNGEAPDFAEDVTGRTVINTNEKLIVTAPSDARYILLMITSSRTDVTPVSVKEGSFVRDDVRKLNEIAIEREYELYGENYALGDLLKYDMYLSPSTNLWTSSNTYGGIFIPVVAGKKMRIVTTSRSINYAFLTAEDTGKTTPGSPSLAGGATWVSTIQANSVIVVDVPSDAVSLYMLAKSSTTDLTTTYQVSDVISVGKQVDNLSQSGTYLRPTKCLEELSLKTINVNGEIIDSGTAGLFLLRKYELSEGKDYYANVMITSGRTLPGVAYYNSSNNFIGYDNAFGQTGKTLHALRRKLNVPETAKYVWLMGAPMSYSSPWPPQLYEGAWSANKDVTPLTIEYHTVKVRRDALPSDSNSDPTSGTERIYECYDSAWAVMWPVSYAPNGKPTQVIAMLHGSEGYVTQSVMGYNTDNWKNWRKKYLDAGYAVMDINGIGVYASGNDNGGNGTNLHYGCPAAIETLDEAFEYLKCNYNVADKLLIHGTSMGGALAQTYTKTYPSKVLAVAVFAPVALIRNLIWRSPIRLAHLFGYADAEESKADNYSKMVGTIPFLTGLAWHDGELVEVPWVSISDDATADAYKLMENFPVPIRLWHGARDTNVPLSYNQQVIDGYRRGGSLATLRICEGADHADVVSGNEDYVCNEALDFFKRYAENIVI